MPAIRGNPAEKWVRRASAAGEDYSQGVANPRRSWQQAATAAAATQAQAVQAAIARGAYSKGIAAAGDAKWQAKAQRLGAARYPGGVAEAKEDYDKGFAPYAQVITSTNLPPRGPKGDPRNLERVRVLAVALNKRKTGAA